MLVGSTCSLPQAVSAVRRLYVSLCTLKLLQPTGRGARQLGMFHRLQSTRGETTRGIAATQMSRAQICGVGLVDLIDRLMTRSCAQSGFPRQHHALLLWLGRSRLRAAPDASRFCAAGPRVEQFECRKRCGDDLQPLSRRPGARARRGRRMEASIVCGIVLQDVATPRCLVNWG